MKSLWQWYKSLLVSWFERMRKWHFDGVPKFDIYNKLVVNFLFSFISFPYLLNQPKRCPGSSLEGVELPRNVEKLKKKMEEIRHFRRYTINKIWKLLHEFPFQIIMITSFFSNLRLSIMFISVHLSLYICSSV